LTVEHGLAEILVHRAAIADLVHRYAFNIRSRTVARCVELFTDDAVFEHWQAGPSGNAPSVLKRKYSGRDEIIESLTSSQPPSGMRLFPMIHNLLIDVRDREAESSCLMVAAVMPGGRQILGEYRDRFRYDSDWRFTLRSYIQCGDLNKGVP
jgi:hypothetical protein